MRSVAQVAFVGKSKSSRTEYETPEELYARGDLPRTAAAVGSLWAHQADALRSYAEQHREASDVALELPTGTGKTLPGLLISEWARRRSEGPVLYATPTKLLATQVLSTAVAEGVPARMLVGGHRDWASADEIAVTGGEAIAITTYSSIFNSSPKLPVPRLIVFDDAHAGEQFVGETYGITIRRHEAEQEYLCVLDALQPFLTELQLQRLRSRPDPGAHHQVRMIIPAVEPAALTQLDAALSKLGDPFKFQFAMIRAGLPACLAYVSYSGIQIRPMVPPTYENKVFEQARQRVYLSATLGGAGELERAFGRSEIERIPLQVNTPPRSGRRLFVFPDIATGAAGVDLTKQIVALTGKALVLSQTSVDTEAALRALADDEIPRFRRDDVESGLAGYNASPNGVLGLANRYDGMDLPGDACRIVVLNGKPDAIGLQERFLSERAQAHSVLSQRLRTRIIQGTGRCTRGPNDFAVVVVSGPDITRYFSQVENRTALEQELQAEVQFGWENSRGQDARDILQNVVTFLEHGAEWRSHGEPHVVDFRESAVKSEPGGELALGRAANDEVEAWGLAFSGDWKSASRKLHDAARTVGQGGEATRGYRGLLLYIAAVWLHLGAVDEVERAHVRQLVQGSAAASPRTTWLKEMKPLAGAGVSELSSVDKVAVESVVAKLLGQFKPNSVRGELKAMRLALAESASGPYESALSQLGRFLGAEAFKPSGSGRCDSAWLWGSSMWVTFEAKSEANPDGLLSLRDIRQTNTQLDQLAVDQQADNSPAGSPSIVISDQMSADPEYAPVANANVYLASTAEIGQIAADVETVWTELSARNDTGASAQALRESVTSLLKDNGCLPTQLLDRLMRDRIRPAL